MPIDVAAPQKDRDRRGERMADTVQAEALSPAQLADELRAAIETVVDLDILNRVEQRGRGDRRQILADLDGLGGAR